MGLFDSEHTEGEEPVGHVGFLEVSLSRLPKHWIRGRSNGGHRFGVRA